MLLSKPSVASNISMNLVSKKGKRKESESQSRLLPALLFCSKAVKVGIRATQSWYPHGRDWTLEPHIWQH